MVVGKSFDLHGEALGAWPAMQIRHRIPKPEYCLLDSGGLFDLHGEALGACRHETAGLQGPGLECWQDDVEIVIVRPG